MSGTDDIALLGQSFNDMAGSLQRQIRRLEDLSRLQRRFTSDVSHELRTPLTTIRMASELLYASRDDFGPELARSAELLHDELDRFESLLGDLLEISRYDAGVAHLESEPADLRGRRGHTVDAHPCRSPSATAARSSLRQPDEPVPVDMDSRRVERILRNLLGNALDHGDGKPVEITVAFDEHCVAVTVRDHGVGLRPGEAGLVFNRFWRGDPSRSRLTGGTGLGLAISLEDARLHDGWLQAWGERGRGAQFRLTLPRRAGHTLMRSPLPLDRMRPTRRLDENQSGSARRRHDRAAGFRLHRRAVVVGTQTVGRVDLESGPSSPPITPAADADPRGILDGFLKSNAIEPKNHTSAREFLSAPMQRNWSDQTVTIVDTANIGTYPVGPSTVTISVRGAGVGSVGAAGVFTPSTDAVASRSPCAG